MKTRSILWLVSLLALPLAGCRAGERGSSRAVVRDSAGIHIVENTAGLWREEAVWRLSAVPEVEIGVVEGEPKYQLDRVTGAVRLDNGRIVVANGGTNELRFYDAAGRYLTSTAGEGEGPGEFKALGSIGRFAGDSLMVTDRRLPRVSSFDASGRFIRSSVPPAISERIAPHPVGPFADGSLLVIGARFGGHDEIRPGVNTDTSTYFRLGPAGAVLDTLGRFPDPETYVQTIDHGFSVMLRPLGRSPSWAIHGDRFYFGSGDTYEIAVYTQTGNLERLIRKEHENSAVTAEDIERIRTERLEGTNDENWRRQIERTFAEMPFPSIMPAYMSLNVDAEGNLWVEEYRRPGDDQPRWTVFDPEGQMLGMVETPPDFTIYQIGSAFVLGVWKDESDVEHIRLYGLVKPVN